MNKSDREEFLNWLVMVILLVLIALAIMHGTDSGIDPNAGQHM